MKDVHQAPPFRSGRPAQSVQLARARFPRGLIQPPGSFRFSVDALLLASFVLRHGEESSLLLDLGCGCGVVGIAVLLAGRPMRVCGVDMQPDLTRAACENSARLGFSHCYAAVCADLADMRGPETLSAALPAHIRPGGVGLVAANPPYRLPGHGRPPRSESRRAALIGDAENLRAFVRVASLMLAPDGKFCVIFPFVRLDELVRELAAQGLNAKNILPVRARAEDEPMFALLAAEKSTNPDAVGIRNLSPTLTLYAEQKYSLEITEAALSFCPCLACNTQNRP